MANVVKTAWSGRSVFVTGGNGFLGSHVVRRLLDLGARVTCLIREELILTRFHLENLKDRVECVAGSITDFQLLYDVIHGQRVDAIFHLAAQPIVGKAQMNPLPTMEANVYGTILLLEAVRRVQREEGRLRAVVVMSSDKAYGEGTRLPYREIDPLRGLAPYEASKVCVDVLSQSYAKSFGLPIGVVRSGNLYGPGDIRWDRIVPGTIRSMLTNERPVLRSDGTFLRDYFYVEDAAAALLMLGEALNRKEIQGEVFNFGTGVPTTALHVLQILSQFAEERLGRRYEPVILNEARGEIRDQYLDCDKAKEMLGWVYQTSLEKGLKWTWDWYETVFRERVLNAPEC